MKVTGTPEQVQLLDQEAYANHVRTHGISEEHLASLHIEFLDELPTPLVTTIGLFPRPYGRCKNKHHIQLATFYVDEAQDRAKALREMNKVCLHETGHMIHWKTTMFEQIVVPFIGVGISAIVLLVVSHLLQSANPLLAIPVTMIIWLGMLWALPKVAYKFSLGERLARKHGDDDAVCIREYISEGQGVE